MDVNHNSLVSVIIPVYNVELWLRECIDSVIAQTLHDIEIICVNDGSMDGSGEILINYADRDSRIRIINQANQGLSGARNTGVREASGKYIYFLDSDDILLPTALEECTGRMNEQNLDFLSFNAVAFGDDPETASEAGLRNRGYFKRNVVEGIVYTGRELFLKLKRDGSYITPAWSCMILRSAFIENNLWFHEGILHEDEPWMFMTLLNMERCGCLSKNYYHYRIRNGSISFSQSTFRHAYGIFRGYLDVRNYLIKHPKLYEEKEFINVGVAHVKMMQQNAIRAYRACSDEEREKRKELQPEEIQQFDQDIVWPASQMDTIESQKKINKELHEWCVALQDSCDLLKKREKEKEEECRLLEESVQLLRESLSYRLGNRIVSPSKKFISSSKNVVKKLLTRKKVSINEAGPETHDKRTNRVTIHRSSVSGNRIKYICDVEGEWKTCFSEKTQFEAEYPFSCEDVPESIRIIPVLSQVLPASWVCDAEVNVEECDVDFIDSISAIKSGYQKMYPMISFAGSLYVEKPIKNEIAHEEHRCLSCFSGGVDAVSTVISHLPEEPVLVSLWGSDVSVENEEAWKLVENRIKETSIELNLQHMTVRTSFRKLLIENELSIRVIESGDEWWHGFQHGLGILGHLAPAAYVSNADTVYIASSFTAEDTYTCASDPSIDNQVHFCGAHVVHDGYNDDRQTKIHRIVKFCAENNKKLALHVCWEREGDNCCHCEKCWRTMLGLFTAGADPKEYGFVEFKGFEELLYDIENNDVLTSKNIVSRYGPIQRELREKAVREEIPESVSWLLHVDLEKIRDGYLRFYGREVLAPLWILGTPEHGNLGDHCITSEEIKYLQSIFPRTRIEEVTEEELVWRQYEQLKRIPPKMPIFLHGGGNIGTIWESPEKIREEVIQRAGDHPVIIMPQSIWFSRDENGKKALQHARQIYKGENLLLCCRDKVSLAFAQSQFACRSILAPDMVMWDRHSSECHVDRFGSMTLLRRDSERMITDQELEEIEDILAKRFGSIEKCDMVVNSVKIDAQNRIEKIDKMLQGIISVECVVTDRLHGMIFCAISETPCVVLGNGYHKVKACYEWLNDVEYIQFVDNVAEIQNAIDKVCACKKRTYPQERIRARFNLLTQQLLVYKDLYE